VFHPLAMLFLRLHHQEIVAAEILWGLWLFSLSVLVYRSRFLPRSVVVAAPALYKYGTGSRSERVRFRHHSPLTCTDPVATASGSVFIDPHSETLCLLPRSLGA
jgi:hypothetical protein